MATEDGALLALWEEWKVALPTNRWRRPRKT